MVEWRQPVTRKIRIASKRAGLRFAFRISLAYDLLMHSGGAINVAMSGAVSMRLCSHIPNLDASSFVRTSRADSSRESSYHANMARRGIPKNPPAWYLPEWMRACGVETQAAMMEKTGWSKAKMSQLYTGKQDFNSEILRETAQALGVERHELLLPPEVAMAIRRLRQAAVQIVHDADRTGTHG